MKTIPIGQLLVDENIITPEQLASALDEQKKTRKRIGEVIADLGYASERDILRTLAQRLGVEYVDSPLFNVELDTVKLIPEGLARQYNILPVYLRSGTLTIATNDPLDFACLEDVAMITSLDIRTVLSPASEIVFIDAVSKTMFTSLLFALLIILQFDLNSPNCAVFRKVALISPSFQPVPLAPDK